MTSELTAKRFQQLVELVAKERGKGRWLVLTHDNPDPDALAAAVVLAKVLSKRLRRPVTAAYGGMIGRAENRQMVKQLGLKISHIRRLNLKNYRHFALVDTQPGTGNNQLPDKLTPTLVIDHHPIRKATYSAKIFDIRPEYGATATILAEYLLASGVDVTKRAATALIYAIRTETQDFGRESGGPDQAAYDRLFPQVDKRALAKIQTPRLPLSYFRTLHEALERLEGVGTLVISHLGDVRQPDIVPEIADLLLRLEGKTWSLCTGRFEDRLYLSLRTTNPRADSGRLMRRLLGRRGKGGGHGTLAGGWMGLEKAPNGDPRTLQHRMAARLAKLLKQNPERIAPISIAQQEPSRTEKLSD